ncbi:MAG: hypothetical protein ACOZF0_13455 [Thermodesulfobacteriota bacterium]
MIDHHGDQEPMSWWNRWCILVTMPPSQHRLLVDAGHGRGPDHPGDQEPTSWWVEFTHKPQQAEKRRKIVVTLVTPEKVEPLVHPGDHAAVAAPPAGGCACQDR